MTKSPDAPPAKSFFVYFLRSNKTSRYYIGSTKDVLKRLDAHNKGNSLYTKSYAPWQLLRVEAYPTLIQARKREVQVKKKKSRKIIDMILADKDTDCQHLLHL